MNKILLKTLTLMSIIGTGYAQKSIGGLNVCPGNTLELKKADSYITINTLYVTGTDSAPAFLKATKPVTIGKDEQARIVITDNGHVIFEDTLTINSKLALQKGPGTVRPHVVVKGKLVCAQNGSIYMLDTDQIDILKRKGDKYAYFDVPNYQNLFLGTVNGNKQTFLGYYDSITSRTEAGYTEELKSLNDLKDSSDAKKSVLVSNLRNKLRRLTGMISKFKNMKIQDYVVNSGTSNISIVDSNKVKCEIADMETIIGSDTITNDKVEQKEGLTLVPPDGTGVFDFYHKFNNETYEVEVQHENVPITDFIFANDFDQTFYEWPSNIQLPLSNETSNNTEFEFKTRIAPSESNTHDLYITNGVQNVETVKFTGMHNDSFTKNVVLNGTLHNVVFGMIYGYVPIDATNIPGDLSLFIENGTNKDSCKNNITNAPIVREDQKVTFSMGAKNTVTFTSADETERVYNFASFTMGTDSAINVGDVAHRGITLII